MVFEGAELNIVMLLPAYRSDAYGNAIGGGEMSNRALVEGLISKGHYVTVVTSNSDYPDSFVRGRLRVQSSSFQIGPHLVRRFLSYFFYSFLVKKTLQKQKIDVLLVATSSFGLGVKSAELFNVPIGLIVRAFENFQNLERRSIVSSVKYLIKKFVLGSSSVTKGSPIDFVVANSQFMAKFCDDFFEKKISTVVYPPLPDLSPNRKIRVGGIKDIGMIGATEKKGFRIFLEMAKKFPNRTFHVWGLMDDEFKKINLPFNLKYYGWSANKDEMYDVDLFLVPSICEETFGRVSVEATMSGAIVLVSDIGGLPETVSYSSDLMVESNSIDAWFRRIDDVCNNPVYFRSKSDEVLNSLSVFLMPAQVENLERVLVRYIKES
ncbi:glycosyltransferase [Kerstersia gyiorum]|uniref:glycosyltransferase n=1 Tax=Kerstersia gyiorum TaxID=206506 RepID=UPI0010706C78|nr:glycosyltransferase [Kerstersia gyiorum]QBR40822.1 glycosyltransferase [Kerstersia gyiorum]